MRAFGSTPFLSEYLRQDTIALEQEVNNMAENRLPLVSKNLIVDDLVKKYSIAPLEVQWDRQSITADKKNIPADIVDAHLG